MFPVIGTNVCPGSEITRFLPEPATWDNVQNDVVPFVIPSIDIVHVLVMVPVHSTLPEIACTCKPLRIKESDLFVPPTFKVTVVVEVVCVAETMLRLAFVGLTLTVHVQVLNLRLLGKVKMKVTLVPAAKSVVAPSVMVIVPNVVHHEPMSELPALSAEIFVPLVACVTVTEKWSATNTTYGWPFMILTCTVVR